MNKTKRIVWTCVVLGIISLFTFFIYAANGDILPDNSAIVTSISLISKNTGTAPFDGDNEPGNDSSSDNNIVRSFDQITWTLENTMAINNTGDQYYTGGTIYFEASVPADLMELVKWNTDAMKWIENLVISDDGTSITGSYTMSTEDTTIPGKQSLVFVLDVLGAPNGTKIEPTFTTWLNGNSVEKRKKYIGDIITVSAEPAYNLSLVRNGIKRETTLDDSERDEVMNGFVYGYAVIVSIQRDEWSEKGIKGIEYPQGDITFDITTELYQDINDHWTDVTDQYTPILYQYCINGEEDNLAYNDDREYFSFYGGGGFSWPYANRNDYKNVEDESKLQNSVYKSGNYNLVQDGEIIHVTLSGYDFDGYFPSKYSYDDKYSDIRYGDGKKPFSVLPFQIFLPVDNLNEEADEYWLTLYSNGNLNATSISGVNTDKQTCDDDDEAAVQVIVGDQGDFFKLHQILDWEDCYRKESDWYTGDAYIYPGEKTLLSLDIGQGSSNSPTRDKIEDMNLLYKFDADCYVPLDDEEIYEYQCGDDFEFDIYYAAKSDGKNWESESEQNSAKIEDLKYYTSMAELYADGNEECIAVLLESHDGYFAVYEDATWNVDITIAIPVRIKETAIVGNTYSFTSDTRLYSMDLDRTVDSVMANGFNGYSQELMVDINSEEDYIKTEYNEYGQIISTTHKDVYSGNSGLVISALSGVNMNIATKDADGNEKINYDFGKNEYDVEFQITPFLKNNPYIDGAFDTTVYVTTTVNNNMIYIPGSSNYGEPEIKYNEWGEPMLTWEIDNCTIGEAIEPVVFSVHLNEELENGEQITLWTTVHAPEVDNRIDWQREDSVTVEIINLASHRLYKTTDTYVTEKNGEIHYTISYKNNTDSEIPNFQLLDILPYNGDSRGTNFSGTYKIDRIDVTQWDGEGNELADNNNVVIKYVNDESVRENISVNDNNLANNWMEVDEYVINDYATALAIIGKMGYQQKLVLDIYLKPERNNGGDVYYNDATARVSTDTAEMVTPAIRSSVVERKISGYVWLDSNKNGLMDDDEQVMPDVEMIITDSQGNSVIDVEGNVINSILTDTNGYYEFGLLPSDKYIISVAIYGTKYKLTEKEIGYNSEINSKFNVDTKSTDVINSLNSVDLPLMEEKYQNVGLVVSNGTIKVLHVLEGTDVSNPNNVIDVLYPTEEYEGTVGEDYSTTDRVIEINNSSDISYELISKTDNYIGKYSDNIQYVIYYYNVLGKITLIKTDINDSTIKIEGAKYKLEKLDNEGKIDINFESIELETNSEGTVIFDNLSAGKYRITETKAPDNYELSDTSMDVEINKDNVDIKLTATDKLKLILPETGSKNYTLVIVGIGLAVMVSAQFLRKFISIKNN